MTFHERHIAVVGLTGAGKTTVGRLLAKRLNRALLDSDQMIEASAATTGAEIAREGGTPVLHAMERDATRRMLLYPDPAILTVPASAVDDAALCRRIAADSFVAWLKASPQVLASRIATQRHRRDLSETDLEHLLAQRATAFADLADVAVPTGGRDPSEIAEQILHELLDSDTGH